LLRNKFIILMFLLFLIITVTVDDLRAEQRDLVLGQRILEQGSRGGDVAILQRKLAEKGFYDDRIDGLYGPKTRSAVEAFQSENELEITGRACENTLHKFSQDEKIISVLEVSREEILLLARVINAEARGESFEGMVAVGSVIRNRVEDDRFPDTLREVIIEEGQFCSLIDGQADLYPNNEAKKAARAALLGFDPTHRSLYFYNPQIATNLAWISNRRVVKRIGSHVFAQ